MLATHVVAFTLWEGGHLLLRRVVGKGDTLLDVALEAIDSRGEQLLLLVRNIGEDIDGLLCTVGL
jgi:hypothetical protein